MAGLLEKLDGQIADVYSSRSRRKASTFRALMDDETWFTAEEAVAAKLADSVTEINATNTHDLSQFKNAPQAVGDTVTVTGNVQDLIETLQNTPDVVNSQVDITSDETKYTVTIPRDVDDRFPKVANAADTQQQGDSVECRLRVLELDEHTYAEN
jgi:hypothetical protein